MGLARVITTIIKSFTGMFQTVDLNEYREVQGSNIKRLKVITSSTDVLLCPSDQENITVELKGQVSKRIEDIYKIDVKQSNDRLDVGVMKRKSFILFGFIMDRSKLQIQVPQKWYETLIVHTSSGDIESDDLKADTLDIRTSSGDVRVKRAEAKGDLSFETSSGKIHTSHLKSGTEIGMRTSSGGIDVDEMVSESIKLKASSGDMDIRNVSAKEITLVTSSGEIDVRDIDGHLTVETSSGDIDITNKNIYGQWDLRAGSGDVSVKLANPESLSITFNGGSGDAKVKINGVDYQMKTEHSLVGKIGAGEHKLNVRTGSGDFRLS